MKVTADQLQKIKALHARGHGRRSITAALGISERQVRRELAELKRTVAEEGGTSVDSTQPREGTRAADASSATATLTREDIGRIRSLDDLLDFFKVDRDRWAVRDFRVNKWESASGSGDDVTITPLYQVRANLIRSLADHQAEVERIWATMLEDAKAHAPEYLPLARPVVDGEPCLFEVAIMDPHIGMMAWGRETGEKYDSEIAVEAYRAANEQLLRAARMHNVERVLFLAGNDFLHVDGPGMGGQRGGATTAGTPQDVDSRLAKMFTTARRALIAAVDQARTVAPVDLVFVPGNHDAQQTYRMAEVAAAWYRNDPDVTVIYGPKKRSYYGYGKNALMLTHGEEYKRQRENLPLIFATECPPELWVGATHREIHTGHFHKKMEGRYTPTSEVDETRGIRTRALPSISATDAWHYTEGYKHTRAATAMVFRRSGGIAGLYEFTL